MSTALVSGGAGFLGSHLCDHLLGQGHRVVCVDNLDTGSLGNIEHIRDDAFVFVNHDLTRPSSSRTRWTSSTTWRARPRRSTTRGCRPRSRSAPTGRTTCSAWRRSSARFLLASTSEVYGDPQIHPQPETYWGNVNPIGPRGVYDEAKRYAEALTMAYTASRGGHGDRADLQHVRPAHAPARRARDPDLRPPGARGQAAHRLRRRVANALLLLRRRPHPRPRRARRVRRAPAREHREPERDEPARARRGRHPRLRLEVRDRLRGAAGRRPAGAPAGHHAGATAARLEPEVDLEDGLRRLLDSLRAPLARTES